MNLAQSEEPAAAADASAGQLARGLSRLAYAALAAIVLAILFSFLRERSALVILSADSDAVSFATRTEAVVAKTPVKSLDVVDATKTTSSVADLDIPDGSSPTIVGTPVSPVSLAGISIPAGWQIQLRHDADGAITLQADPGAAAGATASVIVDFSEGATISTNPHDRDRAYVAKEIGELQIEMKRVNVTFFPNRSSGPIMSQLSPSKLSFVRGVETIDPFSPDAQANSVGSIRSGRMKIAHASEAKLLGPLDRLRFADIASDAVGMIRTDDKTFQVDFRGRAESATDIGGGAEDLRPTWLDALDSSGLLKICLAIFTFFAGLELRSWIRHHR